VDEKNAYGGANGYKEIMKRADVDVVILTTPLNFRPIHTMAAIQAGKHVFAEKGVAVDGPGVRLMIAASKLAAEKKLTIDSADKSDKVSFAERALSKDCGENRFKQLVKKVGQEQAEAMLKGAEQGFKENYALLKKLAEIS
jgi:hypothetical protein